MTASLSVGSVGGLGCVSGLWPIKMARLVGVSVILICQAMTGLFTACLSSVMPSFHRRVPDFHSVDSPVQESM